MLDLDEGLRAPIVAAFAATAVEMLGYAEGYLDAPGPRRPDDIRAAEEARRTILDGMRRNLGPRLYAEFSKRWKAGRARLRTQMEAGGGS
ncbi:hypothetical protein [Nisaea sediminum]|uniref:hypothetical protein n=1 Tax=Nisaea sediminum TaxID=2775867 RepID=UPI00186827F2|nr:hypothetical protein [Nisaea sediminum]